MEDIAARRLKLIGDPEQRYREDPVRMLRAARFEAKLGFTLDPATEAPIDELRHLLTQVPAARLFDETLKLFLTGHGERSLAVLRRRGLLAVLYPGVDRYLAQHPGSLVEQLLIAGLANTDARVAAGKAVTPTFLFTLLLYGPIAAYIEKQPPERWGDVGTILDGCDAALREAHAAGDDPEAFRIRRARHVRAAAAAGTSARPARAAPARAAAISRRLRPAVAACPGGHGATGRGAVVDETAGNLATAARGSTSRRWSAPRASRRWRRRWWRRSAVRVAGAGADRPQRPHDRAGCRPTWASAATWTIPQRQVRGAFEALASLPTPCWLPAPACIARDPSGRCSRAISSMRWPDC